MKSAFGVDHEISKNHPLYLMPRSKKEQRISRAKGAAEGAAIGGVGSAGLTYLLGRGMPYRNKSALVAGGVGAGVSGLAGSTGSSHKTKLVPGKKKVEKSLVPKNLGPRSGTYIKASQLTTKEKSAMSTRLKREKRFRQLGTKERKLP